MTLKQFIYLASGVGIAYIIFVFFAANYPLISWPLIVISASLGASFAFLPVGSRPLDYWLGAFLKAIYSPTKRVWQKNKKIFSQDPLFRSRFVMFNSALHSQTIKAEQTIPIPQIKPAAALPIIPLLQPQVAAVSDLPSKEELAKTVELARQAQNLQSQIIQTERALGQIKTQASQPTPQPVDYGGQVNKILTDLQGLMSQASDIRSKLETINHPKPVFEEPKIPKQKIKVVITQKSKQTQLALTTFPNVINGIVKDPKDEYLEGVVAVIYDKEGLPVRALKTNKLGQFSGSTPLPNGTYTLELEKEGFSFDVLQIDLENQVLPPLIITAKQ